MIAKRKKLSDTAGLVPGTLAYVGEAKEERIKITVFDYNETDIKEHEVKNLQQCFPLKDSKNVSWINVDGIHDLDLIEKLGFCFELHPLILEDIVNTSQRPKLEDFENCLFIVLKMLEFNDEKREIEAEQVSLILGHNFVISFQETEGDVFDGIRERIRSAKGRIRKMGADYLAYVLIDAVIDNYFVIMEKMGEKIEGMEDELVNDPTPEKLQSLHALKRDTIFLRKSVWPLREVVNAMDRTTTNLIKKSTHVYLRDVYDHTIQVIDNVETFRDTLSGMLDIYLSSLSNRMNEIMKVLTIFAAIFIPLTFIAGVYGMNFNSGSSPFNMPELNWRFGYFFAWGLMITVAVVMLAYFKRKKWL